MHIILYLHAHTNNYIYIYIYYIYIFGKSLEEFSASVVQIDTVHVCMMCVCLCVCVFMLSKGSRCILLVLSERRAFHRIRRHVWLHITLMYMYACEFFFDLKSTEFQTFFKRLTRTRSILC